MTCATTTDLLPWQIPAAEKLSPLKVGALFMDMGTGKSRTFIEIALRKLAAGKIDSIVWFCPVSLKETVRAEILKHTTSTDGDINMFDNKTSSSSIPKVLWHIIGIESMSASDRVVLAAAAIIGPRTFVAVDESSYIKGHRSMRTERITMLAEKAAYRMVLTGTPMSQGVVDLFAQMRFLSPKILGYASFYGFAANHLEYSEQYPGMIVRSHNTEYLAAKIAPYTYQVTKEECMDLPPKLYERRCFSMMQEQSEAYEQAKEDFLFSLPEDEIDSLAIFRLFTALQQITCGYLNSEGSFRIFAHRRTDALLDVLSAIPVDEKVIVWAKYHYDVQGIVAAIGEEYGPDSVETFTGRQQPAKRHAALNRFRSEARFIIATPDSMGFGQTVNEAAYAVFYSNSFKYSHRLQAEDRNHRHGQSRRPTYIDIWCDCGIEERIESAIGKKSDTVDAFRREMAKAKTKKQRESLIRSL